jgi:hypothetical protein
VERCETGAKAAVEAASTVSEERVNFMVAELSEGSGFWVLGQSKRRAAAVLVLKENAIWIGSLLM